MDLIFDLIGFLIRVLLDRTEPSKTVKPQARSDSGMPPRPTSARPQAPVPPRLAAQDPVVDGERWRLGLTLLALVVLVIMVVVWVLYMQGWL